MDTPVIAICGIATDQASWKAMPVDSIVVPRGSTIAKMAQTILSKLPDRFALCGHSMGGYIALEIAAHAKERLAGLALISSAFAADTDDAKARRLITIREARADFTSLADRLARAMLSRSSRADSALLLETREMLLRCGAPLFAEQQQATMKRLDYRAGLAALEVPVLVVAGTEDRIIPPTNSAEMADAIKTASCLLIDGCGHLPQIEKPEVVRKALNLWRNRIN